MTQEEHLKKMMEKRDEANAMKIALDELRQNKAFQFILDGVNEQLELLKFPYEVTKDTVDFYRGKYYGFVFLSVLMGRIDDDLKLALANYQISLGKSPKERQPVFSNDEGYKPPFEDA